MRRLGVFALLAGLALAVLPARAAVQIQKVVSPGGIEAWLIEDHKVPILSLRLAFRGGAALDPADKVGLATMTTSLLDEGAGDKDSQAFQTLLDDNAIALRFSAGDDFTEGSLKVITDRRDLGFDLLRLALTEPRFDAEPVERIRNQLVSAIQTNMGNPNWVAQRRLAEAVFGSHPYGRPNQGTIPGIHAITVDDLKGFVARRFGRDMLLVAVAGDITPAELAPALDRIFGALPAHAEPFTVPPVALQSVGETIRVERPLPQTIIATAEQGVKRSDPTWYAASIVNYALGGGGFNARLMEEIRTKRGLSYGIYSSLNSLKEGALITAGGSTKNATAGETLKLLKEEWGKMQTGGLAPRELAEAKTYLTGSLPLSMTSTDRVASLVLQLRRDDLGIDYLARRDQLINGVTLGDANAVAKRLLDPARLTTVLVGKPEGLPATQ